jgi:hypothetical protein
VPPKEDSVGRVIERQWYDAVRREGFRPKEMPYARGVIRETLDAAGKTVEKRLGVWPDASGYCRLEIEFSSRWQPLKSASYCK